MMTVSSTGAQKAGNDERYSLIPVDPLVLLAKLYAVESGPGSFSDLYDHLLAFWGGDDDDPVTGLPHVVHVAYNAFEMVRTDTIHTQKVDDFPISIRYDCIPAEPLRLLARHYGVGAKKYADRNWEKGYEWHKSYDALNRHLWQHWAGEEIDEATGTPHLIAVAWHAIALCEYAVTHPEFDDRPKSA